MTEEKKSEREIRREELKKDGWEVGILHPRFEKLLFKVNNAKTIKEVQEELKNILSGLRSKFNALYDREERVREEREQIKWREYEVEHLLESQFELQLQRKLLRDALVGHPLG